LWLTSIVVSSERRTLGADHLTSLDASQEGKV
jgi:hypothetical protein